MYPFVRMTKEMIRHRRSAPLGMDGVHVSHHICWPWDLDIWMELNNGRTLTLYDLGRIPMAKRSGLIAALSANRWGLTMAGAMVRYRRRVRVFHRVEIRSRAVGWDDRFLYIEQSMWNGDDCANHIIYRAAVTGPDGIVPPARVVAAMGHDPVSPPLPVWVQSWAKAELKRPWPPEM